MIVSWGRGSVKHGGDLWNLGWGFDVVRLDLKTH